MASWFSGGGALDEQIERATSEALPSGESDIALELDICDAIRSKSVPAKDAMRSLKKRLNHKNPNVQLHVLKLTDVCVKNGGYHFLIEIASREFMDNLASIARSKTVNSDVKESILDLIQSWAAVFESQLPLQYVSVVYKDLKAEGFTFPAKSSVVNSSFIDSSAPPDWTDSEVCMRCRTPFSFTNRKHHCRNCGNVVDQQCSSKSIPLPQLGIMQPVRVCDTCYALKAPKPTTHRHHRKGQRSATGTMGVGEDEDDFQKALKLSMQDGTPTGSSGYKAPAPEPIPAPARKAVAQEDEDDADMRAAIEASLRDLEGQQQQKTTAPAPAPAAATVPLPTSSLPPYGAPSGAYQTSATSQSLPPPTQQITVEDMENVNLFSVVVDQMKNEPRAALLRDPKMQELYNSVVSLRPRFTRDVTDTYRKYDALVDMYQKLSTAVKYYDQILDSRLGYAMTAPAPSVPSTPFQQQAPQHNMMYARPY
ncbi:uncharacterized protein V1518DRAFT_413040 [Limtongia smithiae]|uniref:uncharacterized protein n=1 Tax=Limtongia smithiae TaxID=1125753 RepID=UPI0034CEF4DA